MKRLLALLLLTGPASANELIYLNPNRGQRQPARIEVSTPEGGVCRKTARSAPELVLGGSMGRGEIIPGGSVSRFGETYSEGGQLSGGVPTFGAAIRIPLGQENIGSCNQMITVLDVQTRVEVAERMFEQGLITQEELESVASRAYQVIADF